MNSRSRHTRSHHVGPYHASLSHLLPPAFRPLRTQVLLLVLLLLASFLAGLETGTGLVPAPSVTTMFYCLEGGDVLGFAPQELEFAHVHIDLR